MSVLALLAAAAIATPATVTTESGAVVGKVESDVLAFKAIPYAAPPVGPLRWRAPQPATAWTGARDASAIGPDCVQGRMPGSPPPAPQAEDCLTANVWRPAEASKKPLPVMVWIHGGAFVNGGSSSAETFGDAMARRGLVFVSFNYRLGRFGFFGHPALTAEPPKETKGNYGLMDQAAALRWVKRNIAAFGGDPNNVTVVGGSAGGISINLLTATPREVAPFDKAIIQSGAGRKALARDRRLSQDLPGTPSADSVGLAFASKLGVEGSDAKALAALRALPADKIADNLSMATLVFAGDRALYSGPTIDGRFVQRLPEETYAKGLQRRVPTLVGATTADLSLDFARSKDEAFARFGPDAEAARQAYDPAGALELKALSAAIGGDRNMVEPARFIARATVKGGAPAWEFRFGYIAPAALPGSPNGANHSTEVAYAFDKLSAVYKDVTPQDAAVAKRLADYWANFARAGDPNGKGLPKWPRYDAKGDVLLDVQTDGAFVAKADPWRARLDVSERAATR